MRIMIAGFVGVPPDDSIAVIYSVGIRPGRARHIEDGVTAASKQESSGPEARVHEPPGNLPSVVDGLSVGPGGAARRSSRRVESRVVAGVKQETVNPTYAIDE